MATKLLGSVVVCCAVLGELVSPARASADDVVAELARDTPIAAYGSVLAWSDYDAAAGLYRLVVHGGGKTGSIESSCRNPG